jgi:glycosyltransferase involved in cell wall biosynthesis
MCVEQPLVAFVFYLCLSTPIFGCIYKASMNNKVARVLIADASIPTAGYGSWSQRIAYLLQQYEDNRFDYLVAEYTDIPFQSNITHRFNCKQDKSRLLNRLFPGWRYRNYTKSIAEVLSRHDQAIICIIDSLRTKKAIWNYIKKEKLEARVKLLYYQCGFSKYISPADYERFIEGLDACIYLTRNAYRFDLRHNSSMPFPVHVLHNPINHHSFHPVEISVKRAYKKELGIADGIHFIWASQNRPKKGLEVILEAWMQFYSPDKNVQLHVIGVTKTESIPGVNFYGKMHSAEMHKWFKAADIGVFSSLWPEGFSLSLAEQISCGLFCIASTAGCVEEFFIPGEHGIAIEDPNLVDVWVNAFGDALNQLEGFQQRKTNAGAIKPPFLTYNEWCDRFQQIFDGVEQRMLLK